MSFSVFQFYKFYCNVKKSGCVILFASDALAPYPTASRAVAVSQNSPARLKKPCQENNSKFFASYNFNMGLWIYRGYGKQPLVKRSKDAVMITVFSWRNAVQKSSLNATTRHVLLNLSTWMNASGLTCWPSIAEQAETCGLSERAVTVNLQHAIKAGFLVRILVRDKGERWAHYVYEPTFPSNMRFPTIEDYQKKQGELKSGDELRPDPNDNITPNQGHTNTPLNSPISKDKKYKKGKSEKVSLSDWEEKVGAPLNHQMMAGWISAKKLCPVLVQEKIELFRMKMTAGDNRYANFVAAFQNYILSGYMATSLKALARETSPHNGPGYHEKVQRGVSI